MTDAELEAVRELVRDGVPLGPVVAAGLLARLDALERELGRVRDER